MCLTIDYDDCATVLASGRRTARKHHRCSECGRTIDPGEHYDYWTTIGDDFTHSKMCAHCAHTLDLGVAFTGCPRHWYWQFIHDPLPDEAGFVGDIIHNHPLTDYQRRQMWATVIGRRAGWRHPDGTVMPIPLPIDLPDPDPDCRGCDGTGCDGWRLCDCVADRATIRAEGPA